MMDENIEIEISFYCDCIICKGHYHDLTNFYKSNTINLEQVNIRIDEKKTERNEFNSSGQKLSFRFVK